MAINDYQTHDWIAVFMELDAKFNESEAFKDDEIFGMDSESAQNYDKSGSDHEIFLYDLEQIAAGQDKIYGMMSLNRLNEDFILEDGTIVKSGALHYVITHADKSSDRIRFAHLFEKI